MGHPGTFHFRGLIDEVSNGVFEAGVVRVLTGHPPLSPVNAGALVEARWSRSSGPRS